LVDAELYPVTVVVFNVAADNVPFTVVVLPDLPIVTLLAFVVPTDIAPAVPVAVPASILIAPEFDVAPVAFPVATVIPFEAVLAVDVAAVAIVCPVAPLTDNELPRFNDPEVKPVATFTVPVVVFGNND
jgi:hypothetical protein